MFASVASLLAITVDRYIYIVKPLKYPLIVTRPRVFVAISAIWLITCCIMAVWYIHIEIDKDRLRSVCFLMVNLGYVLDTFGTYIPVCLIIILNWRILLVSRKQRKQILCQTLPAPNNNEDPTNEKTRMKFVVRFLVGLKAAKTFSIVVAVLMFCIFAPTLISEMLLQFCSPECEGYFLVIFRYEFYGLNSVVNAFIYGMRHVKYRKAFAKILFKVASRFKESN